MEYSFHHQITNLFVSASPSSIVSDFFYYRKGNHRSGPLPETLEPSLQLAAAVLAQRLEKNKSFASSMRAPKLNCAHF